MAEPTNYDKLQDDRLGSLESLITAEYQPPAGVEYSFPVANRGITQEQFRLMSLGQANGIIHGDNGTVNDSPSSTGYRYYLDGHSSDSETNQRNTLILRAGTSAEAIVEGFYHRLTEDMELPFPPVTTTTVYRVTLTYDPRKFKTSPVNIEVWAGEPPTAYGQVHLLLHTVERRANQLLSQATITRYRQYTAGVLSVQNENQLPDVDSVPAGTLAVPSGAEGRGIFVRSNTTPKRWINITSGGWEDCRPTSGWSHSSRRLQARRTSLGIQLRGGVSNTSSQRNSSMARLPNGYPDLSTTYDFTVAGSPGVFGARIGHVDNDANLIQARSDTSSYMWFDGIIIPHN